MALMLNILGWVCLIASLFTGDSVKANSFITDSIILFVGSIVIIAMRAK